MCQGSDREERPATAATRLPNRFLGVLFAPSRAFSTVVAWPAWPGMLVLVVLVPVACDALFFSFEVGRLALVDRQASRLEWLGQPVSDEVWQAMHENVDTLARTSLLSTLLGGALGAPGLAGVLWLRLGRSRGVTFQQILGVVTHSGAVLAARWIVVTPLRFRYESLSSPLNLAAFVSMLDEGGVMARFLGAIDVFVLWWLIVLSKGLGVAYRRPARPLVLRMMAAYGAVGAAVAVTGILLGGS